MAFSSRFHRWVLRTAFVANAILALSAAGAHAAKTPTAPAPSCFWSVPIVLDTLNVGFPDTGAVYYYNNFKLPPGAEVVFHGTYPHARYFSFNSYFTTPTLKGVPSDAIHDAQIAPDPGSWNPFLPGAKRAANLGTWTVTVTGLQPPSGPRDPNTLYAGTQPLDQTQPVELIYRVYIPDKNRDLSGDGGLPDGDVVLADGTTLTGQAACDALQLSTAFPSPNTLPLAQYLALTHLPAIPALGAPGSSPEAPALNPGSWYAAFNSCHQTDPYFVAAGYPLNSPPLTPVCPNARAVTQWANIDNQYISSGIDRRFGPAAGGHNVAVVHGKLPVTPATYRRVPSFEGGTDMRYWSLCQNESLVTTKAVNCVYDEQVPVDDEGFYTIVLSTAEDRPANATTKCGVPWLEWSPNGDGAGRPTSAVLIIRNMLPDSSFTQAIQNVPAPGLPGNVTATMGDYAPTVEYESKDDFEARGCSK